MSVAAKKQKRKILIPVVSVVLFMLIISCAVYLNDYYKADIKAIEGFMPENNVSKQVLEDNTIIYTTENADTGFIFYPGGKVEYTAYEPLMESLASEGIMCVLVEMPFHLAVFDIEAAEGIQEQFPDIKNWYMGGHSLGGSMAATYLSKHKEDFEGIVLLGAYSTADLSSESLKVLSIYGSEDQVLNHEKYVENKRNLPDNFAEVVIDGGCHAYFGMYGPQEGDGVPAISNEEQVELTTEAIVDFVN